MLLRVDHIQEIGRFASLSHKAPQFPRLALVYARNGFGKSTFSSILRSASETKEHYITARRRLGALKESAVRFQWQAHGLISFANGKWNGCPGNVYIFDQDYVQQNLHVGESVTRDHKRSLLKVVLGATGVELAHIISEFDAKQRELASKLAACEKLIKIACPGFPNISAFCSTPVPENIDDEIRSAKQALELSNRSVIVRERSGADPIKLQPFSKILDLLSRSISDVTEQTAIRVKEHLDAHNMHQNGLRWLRYGVDHTVGTSCPFCTQDTKQVDLVRMFQGYFSHEYSNLEAEIANALLELDELIEGNSDGLKRMIDQNLNNLEFWRTVCQIDIVPNLTAEKIAVVSTGMKRLSEILRKKANAPHLNFSLSEDDPIGEADKIIREYNAAIAQCMEVVESTRNQVAAIDPELARRSLAVKEHLRAKLSDPLKSEVQTYLSIIEQQDEIAKAKKVARDDLRKFTESVIGERQEEINRLLEDFGANFAITDTKASYVGREPNTDYSILIGPHKVPVGEKNDQAPCFKTVLSTGDKFTLALALFISQVRSQPGLNEATIVFDDPFNSQDLYRQWETASQIRALSNDACQVIVLSHDPRFLQLIRKEIREPDHCKEFQLTCDHKGDGKISSWSSDDELKSIYVRQAERIREYAKKGEFLKCSDAESLIKDLRPFLEDFLRARFPARFGELAFLSEMTDEIEVSGPDDPMFDHVETFRAINEFTRGNMHGGALVPDPQALRAKCRQIVKIVGAY